MSLPLSSTDGYSIFSTREVMFMARFKGAVLTCKVCGDEFRVPPSRSKTASTCSKECADAVRGAAIERKVTLTCAHCGGGFRVPRCHAERRSYCSYVCREADQTTQDRKASKVGEANGNWVGGIVRRSDGYLYERVNDHPFQGNGYVLQHRMVVERHLRETDPTSSYLTTVNGERYLSPAYHVHHRNEVRDDNAIANLECMTPSAHRAHHNEIMRKALAFYRLHHAAGSD